MIATKQRVVFNLDKFVMDLEQSLTVSEDIKEDDDFEYVEDVIDKLKNFIAHSNSDVVKASYKYLIKHPTVLENSKVMSFIETCFD